MKVLTKKLALAPLVVSLAVAPAGPAAARDGQATTTPLAGPSYTPQELEALIAYSNSSFAQKQAILAGTPTVTIVESGAFDWGDAGVGAAGAFGLALLAGGITVVSRHNRRSAS